MPSHVVQPADPLACAWVGVRERSRPNNFAWWCRSNQMSAIFSLPSAGGAQAKRAVKLTALNFKSTLRDQLRSPWPRAKLVPPVLSIEASTRRALVPSGV